VSPRAAGGAAAGGVQQVYRGAAYPVQVRGLECTEVPTLSQGRTWKRCPAQLSTCRQQQQQQQHQKCQEQHQPCNKVAGSSSCHAQPSEPNATPSCSDSSTTVFLTS
jgi:hypothetical protein